MKTCEAYLKEVKERVDKATPGPWFHHVFLGLKRAQVLAEGEVFCAEVLFSPTQVDSNGVFIAHSRTDTEILIKMIECARDRLNMLLNAATVCAELKGYGALHAMATKAHVEDTLAKLDRLAGEVG